MEGSKYCVVIGDCKSSLVPCRVGNDVALVTAFLYRRRWVVAFYFYFLEHAVVVARILHVFVVPINKTTCPLDGSLSVCRQAGWPEGKLHTGWGLRVVVSICGAIPGVFLLDSTEGCPVDGPGYRVGFPIDFVVVVCVKSIQVGDCYISTVVVYCCVSMPSGWKLEGGQDARNIRGKGYTYSW